MPETTDKRLATIDPKIKLHSMDITNAKIKLKAFNLTPEEQAFVEGCTKEAEESLNNITNKQSEVNAFLIEEASLSRELTNLIALFEAEKENIEKDIEEFSALDTPQEHKQKVKKMIYELTAAHEELTSTLDELKQQQTKLSTISEKVSSELAEGRSQLRLRDSPIEKTKEEWMDEMLYSTQKLSSFSAAMNVLQGIADGAKDLFLTITSQIAKATRCLNATQDLRKKAAELKEELELPKPNALSL